MTTLFSQNKSVQSCKVPFNPLFLILVCVYFSSSSFLTKYFFVTHIFFWGGGLEGGTLKKCIAIFHLDSHNLLYTQNFRPLQPSLLG